MDVGSIPGRDAQSEKFAQKDEPVPAAHALCDRWEDNPILRLEGFELEILWAAGPAHLRACGLQKFLRAKVAPASRPFSR